MTRRRNFDILGLAYYRSALWWVISTGIVLLEHEEVNAEVTGSSPDITENGEKG